MRSISLRMRLAIASALGVMVVMTVAAVSQYAWIIGEENHRIDESLAQEAAIVMNYVKFWPNGQLLHAAVNGDSLRLADADNVPLPVDDAGRLLFADPIPMPEEVRQVVRSGETSDPIAYDVMIGDVPGRVLATFPVPGATLLVARQNVQLASFRRESARFLFVEVTVSMFLAGILGYLVTRVTMRPVRRLASTARAIADTSDLGKRVAASRSDRDLDNLTQTFNDMLDRLEVSYDQLQNALDVEKRFVADASHELRTPLTTINGNVDYLARTGADPDAIADIRIAAARLTDMVAKLTQLAREEGGVTDGARLLDFSDLVEDVCDEPAYDGVTLRRHVEPNLWVEAAEGSLASVVRNLLDNAVKYGNGEIDVRVRAEGASAVLDVRDNGSGVSVAEVDRVFERFWRSADAKSGVGSGLGLSIVRSAVESHGGGVRAFSGPGGHFEVRLPLQPVPQLDSALPDRAKVGGPGG